MAARIPQRQEQDKTGFLDLAAETRNDIYALWAQDVSHVGIRAKGKAHTTAAHPATQLSRLVHREFTGVIGSTAALLAQSVKVQIEDLEFYPLITYLNRVIASPDADWRDFQLFGGRSLIIELSFSARFWKNPPVDQVIKWAKMLKRKVNGIQYTMRVVSAADPPGTKKFLRSMCDGSVPSDVWMEFATKFREWEDQQAPAVNPFLVAPPAPKTALEQAVDDYYDAIYAEMDAKDAERLARKGEVETEVEGE